MSKFFCRGKIKIKRDVQPCVRPHFEVYFTVSYGLSRDELEDANFLVKNSDPLTYKPTRKVCKKVAISSHLTLNTYLGTEGSALHI